MIKTLRLEGEAWCNGYVFAYVEWDILDSGGKVKNDGEYIHIRDLWVHPRHDGKVAIAKLIVLLDNDKRNKNIKYVYWLRNNVRPSKLFKRTTAVRRSKYYANKNS